VLPQMAWTHLVVPVGALGLLAVEVRRALSLAESDPGVSLGLRPSRAGSGEAASAAAASALRAVEAARAAVRALAAAICASDLDPFGICKRDSRTGFSARAGPGREESDGERERERGGGGGETSVVIDGHTRRAGSEETGRGRGMSVPKWRPHPSLLGVHQIGARQAGRAGGLGVAVCVLVRTFFLKPAG
jgi:hypothetical protein